jgi:DNA-binding transcriptional regulator YdaS (Cro superfamily)
VEDREQVRRKLEQVSALVASSSWNRLAGKLDVTRQAINKWIVAGEVPAARACQIELLTEGAVTWKELCPKLVRNTEI